MSVQAIIIAAVIVGGVGLFIGFFLGFSGEKFKVEVDERDKSEQRTISPAICVYIDANGLHELNNERGHEAGDLMLHAVAESLMEQFPKGSLYRVGGDEFVVFPAPVEGQTCEDRMRSAAASITAQGYSISYGIAAHESVVGLRELVREADEKMLESKLAYYAEHDRRVRK